MPQKPKATAKRRQQRRGRPRLKMIVHPDFGGGGKMPPQLKRKWMQSIYRMKRNPKKFLLIVTDVRKEKDPNSCYQKQLRAALRGQQGVSDLSDLIGYAIRHIGKERIVVLNFSVTGRVKDYPIFVSGLRDFEAWPKYRLRRILEGRGVKVEDIERIEASGIYLGECVTGEALLAAGVLGVPLSRIKYLKNESVRLRR